jgi:hypothetical protein
MTRGAVDCVSRRLVCVAPDESSLGRSVLASGRSSAARRSAIPGEGEEPPTGTTGCSVDATASSARLRVRAELRSIAERRS